MTTTQPNPKALPVMTLQLRWSTFIQGLWFVFGFATFIIGVMGLASTALGDVFFAGRKIVPIIGGIALIIFGRRTAEDDASRIVIGAVSSVTRSCGLAIDIA